MSNELDHLIKDLDLNIYFIKHNFYINLKVILKMLRIRTNQNDHLNQMLFVKLVFKTFLKK